MEKIRENLEWAKEKQNGNFNGNSRFTSVMKSCNIDSMEPWPEWGKRR